MTAGWEPIDEIIIPAPPGWFVVVPVHESKGVTLHRISVIAWHARLGRRPDGDTFVDMTAVTCNGSIGDQDHALQWGDRPPFYTVFEDFDDEAALLAYFEKSQRGK